MEEKKNAQAEAPKKLSYEELVKTANELSIQNQKLVEYINQLRGALAENDFNRISFFLSMLFKVTDHAELYSDDFVHWTLEKIETAMRDFSKQLEEPEKDETK